MGLASALRQPLRVPFTYADNTMVSINPNQRVTVLLGRYIYTFR